MDSISSSGDARRKLMMTADTKDAKAFFSVKTRDLEQKTTLELIFVESLFMMCINSEKRSQERKLNAPHLITSGCIHITSVILFSTEA